MCDDTKDYSEIDSGLYLGGGGGSEDIEDSVRGEVEGGY